MHYRNGEQAKVGHIIIAEHYNGQTVIGQVVSAQPGSATCNLNVAPIAVVHGIERDSPVMQPANSAGTFPVTASQALRIDMRPRILRPEDDFEKQSAAYLNATAPA